MDDATRLIRAGHAPDTLARTVGPPIQKGSTVLLPNAAALYDDDGYLTYGRTGLAAQATLADALSQMEGAVGTALYPSGVAAMSGAMLAVLRAGDQVLVADTVYRPTRRFCDTVLKRFGIETVYFDPLAAPDAVFAEAGPNLRLVVLESPGSLSFEMQDLTALAAAARARGALSLIDNTWGVGFLYKPLAHGVDISVQSLTKYVGGHSDVFMGSAAASDPVVWRQLDASVLQMGWAVASEDSYLMLRGLRTLPTRLARHGDSGLRVAAWLRDRAEVVDILHPALPGAPGHDLWKRDFAGTCGLFSLILRPGPDAARTEAAVSAFLDALTLFGLGFSWGGFESLAINCDPQLGARRFRKSYPGPMIRLHVGLEDPADLIADLETALAAYAAAL